MSLQDLLPIIVVLLLALSWHEAAHAWVADRLGDHTARDLGRVTLNPIKHLDPFLSVLLPIVMLWQFGWMFGGGKPVPVVREHFRHPARDFMFVALAGPFSNLVLAAGFVLLFAGLALGGVFEPTVVPDPFVAAGERVFPATLESVARQGFLGAFVSYGVFLNVLLAVFNLIPLPPLDGSRVVAWALPGAAQRAWYSLDRFGLLLLIAFFFLLDGFTYVLAVFEPVQAQYHVLAAELVGLGAGS